MVKVIIIIEALDNWCKGTYITLRHNNIIIHCPTPSEYTTLMKLAVLHS